MKSLHQPESAFYAILVYLMTVQPNAAFHGQNNLQPMFGYCLYNHECNQTNLEVCNRFGQCDCHPTTQLNYEDLTCRLCPSIDVACAACCVRYNYQCVYGICRNCLEYNCFNELPVEMPPPDIVYITASQIALSAALLMGTIALITLLYRICSKSPTSRRPHSQSSSDGHQSAFQRISQRLSLNSMQVRILARLQDQPPKYETQHNYDTRMQLDRESQNPDDTRPPPIVPTVSTNAIYVAPPAYGDERYSLKDLPPPYSPSDAVEDTSHHSARPAENVECVSGRSDPITAAEASNGTIRIV